jgi:hypothetical protein
MVIDGQRHVGHWHSDHAIVLQNYSRDGRQSAFHVFAIEREVSPQGAIRETLGQLLGSFPNINAAIDRAAKEQSAL